MTCPHCKADVKSPVVETRQHEGDIYRRRSCGNCGRSYITVETSPVGQRMPAAVVNGHARGVSERPKAAPRAAFNGNGAHLEGVWK